MNEVTASEIAQNLDVADEKAKYDASARKLVAQKSVLAYILKSALDEFADIPVKQIAEEFIEGTPQVSEAAVHQDHPDAVSSGESKEMLNGSDRIEGMPTEDIAVREGTVRYDIRFLTRVPGGDDRMEIIVNVEVQSRDTEVTEEISREVSQVCNLSTGIYDKGIQEGKREGALEILFGLVKDNLLSIADAAKRANIERSVFEKEYMAHIK